MSAIRPRIIGCLIVAAGVVLLGGSTALAFQGTTAIAEPTECAGTGCGSTSTFSNESPAPTGLPEPPRPEDAEAVREPAPASTAQSRLESAATVPATNTRTVLGTQGKSESVAMGDDFFAPEKVTVPVGTTVTWTNQGQRPHTSTADDGSWDSGGDPEDYVLPGQSFSHTFTAAGRFPYYCRLHGDRRGVGMAGVITVTAPPEAPGGPQAPPATNGAGAEAEAEARGPGAEAGAPRTSDDELAATGPEHIYLILVGFTLITIGSALLLLPRRKHG